MTGVVKKPSALLRIVLTTIGVALAAWALSDDYLIGGGPGFGLFQAGVLALGVIAAGSALLSHGVAVTALTAVLTILVALAMGEFVLRGLVGARFESTYQLHEDYIYELKPGSRRQYVHLPANGGDSLIYRVNSDGFRGDELESGNDATRVVVYGDSFIHAEYSHLEDTFVKRLESHLSEAGSGKVEVVNAGVAGYGPDQVLLRLDDELPWLDPELLIVGIYAGNDFGDLVRNKLFRLDDAGNLVRNDPRIDPEIVYGAKLSNRELVLRKVLRNAADAIGGDDVPMDMEGSIDAAMAQQVREYEEFVEAGDDTVRELRSDPYSVDVSAAPDSASARYKVQLMSAVLSRIQQTSEAHRVPAIFVIIPHPIDVLRGNHSSGVVNRSRFPNYNPDRLTSTLVDVCRDHDLRCVDLLNVMREQGGESLYLKGGDDHWNDRGQHVAARYVASWLKERGEVALPQADKAEAGQ